MEREGPIHDSGERRYGTLSGAYCSTGETAEQLQAAERRRRDAAREGQKQSITWLAQQGGAVALSELPTASEPEYPSIQKGDNSTDEEQEPISDINGAEESSFGKFDIPPPPYAENVEVSPVESTVRPEIQHNPKFKRVAGGLQRAVARIFRGSRATDQQAEASEVANLAQQEVHDDGFLRRSAKDPSTGTIRYIK